MANPSFNFDPKEAYHVINSSLPNIANYLKVVLKKEKLTEEAESRRQKYEKILNSLEHGVLSVARPPSFICDDDSGYFSANRSRGVEDSDQLKAANISGYLLWKDEKGRWRRCWCKAENRDMRFYVYEDNIEDILVRSFSLENTTAYFEDQVTISGKDNSFLLSGVLFDAIGGTNKMEATTIPGDAYFAAYTESECKNWKETLHHLMSTCDTGEGSSWIAPALPQDSASSSSSNFSSNRDSMISTTSSLINTYRAFSRSDLGEGKDQSVSDNGRTPSSSKQQQPLPSPPHQLLITSDDDSAPTHLCEEEDNVSVGTIYESIDNLVLQCDDAIRNMGESMKTGSSNPFKKKERSIFRQQSSRRSNKSNIWSEKRAEFEKGERFSGFMLKKNNSGYWKKKWCVLKGCVFGYYKSRSDSQGQEFVILNGNVQSDIQDDKKSFVFSLSCTGVHDMHFSVDDEETYHSWVSKLQAACASVAEYSHALQVLMDGSTVEGSSQLYNIPRTLLVDSQLYDTPRGNSASPFMTPDAAIDSGIYNVPRTLMMQSLDDTRLPAVEDAQYLLGSSPLDIYDYPRVSISPDEEGIYDDPLDIIDMEIYDYPPDASELGLEEEFSYQSSRSSTISEYAQSNSANMSSHNPPTVPPLPSGARPSTNSLDGNQNLPTTTFEERKPYPVTISSDGDLSTPYGETLTPVEASDPSVLDFGQCALRGYLFKKERFMTWVKLFCVIRNNFLECRKSHGSSCNPSLKLFLPGSEVKEGGGDAKKKWAFQIRHPRREGILIFAADCEADLRRWMKAFQSGTSIQVQPVSTVEEIRITDLEMQKRWTTSEKSNPVLSQSAIPPEEESLDKMPPRRKTFSAGSVPEEFSSDTLKRRSKFSWVKSNFMRRKNEKKILSGSQTDLHSNRSSTSIFSSSSDAVNVQGPDPLRKSVSLELLPTTTDSDESSLLEGNMDDENFQGYLRVQRRGADNVWVRYWCVLKDFNVACYISRRDLTLALSIQLQGSRVAESEMECQRKHSIKVLHMESGQCLYFAADNHEDFFRWFSEITTYGHQVVSDDSDTTFGPFVQFYFIPKDAGGVTFRRLSVVSEGGSSNFSEGSATALTKSSSILYRGELLKASHTGKWKQRYCVINGSFLSIFHSSTESSPIISLPLCGISLELINTTQSSKDEYQFKLNPNNGGKSHTFSAPSETEMYAWVSALRDGSCIPMSSVGEKNSESSAAYSPTLSGKSLKRKSKKLKDADLISYIPASSIKNPDYSGYADVQYGMESYRYWCVASGNCLYVYQSKSATSTIKTVVLPGYSVEVGEPHSLSLHHEGVAPVSMSVENQDVRDCWATILEMYTRAEGSTRNSGKRVPDSALAPKATSKGPVTGVKKKGPVKADHNICGVKASNEEGSGSGESGSSKQSVQNYQDSSIRRYEKRIRKTHRVADQTELKLKKQQTSLLHFKKELSRHVVKLQELSSSGNPHAMKRLKNIRLKLAQLDKIVPYLGKYISVNRQAEMQTIAVLKESCAVELQKLSQKSKPVLTESKYPSDYSASPSPSMLSSVLSSHNEDSQGVKQVDENPYASLSEVQQEPASSSKVKVRSNYAELDFQKFSTSGSVRPPSVKYSEVIIGIGTVEVGDEVQSSAASLVLPPVLQEMDDSVVGAASTHDTTLTPENAIADQDSSYNLPTNSPKSVIHHESSEHQNTETDSGLPSSPQKRTEVCACKSSPPPVAKKPILKQSPNHTLSPTEERNFHQENVLNKSINQSSSQNTAVQVVSSSGPDAVLPFQGLPSISDRIKALQ